MKILIPPSEGKAKVKTTSSILFDDTDFIYDEYVDHIVTLLSLIVDEDLKSIYGTSEEKALTFHRQNQDIYNSQCIPAIERYTGVVYEHINWSSLSEKAKKFMEKHIRIFSGMFGMLTPLTMIPDYKLKMNVLNLQHHWSPLLTEELAKEDIVIDLLPQVHRKAYKAGKNVVRIDFSVITKGKKTAAGHFGKAVKGELIKYIATNQITDVKGLADFEYDGFHWDKKLKTFVKET
tara:strand:+ start:333 stop:1034 length:702 start_codon:yes stop_codon:yes gene_type:complete